MQEAGEAIFEQQSSHKGLVNLQIDTVTDLNSQSLCTFERQGGSTANACVP
jgi:hypothetical protein